jgi:hypothetical protein
LARRLGRGAFLASAKHPGGTGQAYFTSAARTANGYSVAANGNLLQNTLIVARGWLNAARPSLR